MVDGAIAQSVRRYLAALREQGLEVSFGVVFGSQAQGRADTWSDIDLLVVSPRFDGAVGQGDIDRLWHLAAHLDNRIEPIPCGAAEWRASGGRSIVEIARRQGVAINLN